MIKSEENSSGVVNPLALTKKWDGYLSVISGIAGGMADTLLLYPPYGIKYRREIGQPFSPNWFTPRQLYCGVIPYAASIVPATMLQYAIDHAINNRLDKNAPSYQHALAAFTSGAISSFAMVPMGNTIITMMSKNFSTIDAVRYLVDKGGVMRLYRALPFAMARDSLYAGGVFWGGHHVCAKLQTQPTLKDRDNLCKLISAVLVGTTCSLISHPFDAIASQLQANEAAKLETWKIIKTMQQKGLKGFYPGASWRTIAIIGGVTLVPSVTDKTNKFLTRWLEGPNEAAPEPISRNHAKRPRAPYLIRKF